MHPQGRPHSSKPTKLPDRARLFLVGDFGTGLYGAPVTAKTVEADPEKFDLLVHLGDVYYSGEKDEVQQRLLDIWPKRAEGTSRNLNGNHDMYSRGYGYFDVALPAFGQDSSYFAFQNSRWTLLFLDTSYKDNNLGRKQVKWIGKIMEQSGDRRVILFSHHPLFSNFKDQGVKLEAKLHPYLESGRIAAWYWAHEHHCAIYEPHHVYGLRARCIGNGGMPAKRKGFLELPVERQIGDLAWRRMTTDITPSCLLLDGPNSEIPVESDKYLPHGYATLELNGARLTETIFSCRGQEMYRCDFDGSESLERFPSSGNKRTSGVLVAGSTNATSVDHGGVAQPAPSHASPSQDSEYSWTVPLHVTVRLETPSGKTPG
jgi:hypothetical protein